MIKCLKRKEKQATKTKVQPVNLWSIDIKSQLTKMTERKASNGHWRVSSGLSNVVRWSKAEECGVIDPWQAEKLESDRSEQGREKEWKEGEKQRVKEWGEEIERWIDAERHLVDCVHSKINKGFSNHQSNSNLHQNPL